MSKMKHARKTNAGDKIEVGFSRQDNIPFRSKGQTFEFNGNQIECVLREPGKDPAFRVGGQWIVVKLKDVAQALHLIGGE